MGGPTSGEIYISPMERDALLAEVSLCDRATEAARESRDQQKLLVQLEKGLHLRRRLYQEASPEVVEACRQLCEACNYTATLLLQQDNLKGAHELLKRAEQVAERSDRDRAITWNNLACYYRRIGKLRTAVTFLERALAIEEYTGNPDAAQTHLNICATLSQLKRHSEALHHAQCALIRIYEILGPRLLGLQQDTSDSEQVTVLCISYHNLAVEHEHLKNLDAAVCAYAEGFRWASRFLGSKHQLTGILRDSVEAVKAKLPATSGSSRRATEILRGWPQLANSLERTERSQDYGSLMTPRNVPEGVDSAGGDNPSKYSEEFSAPYSSQTSISDQVR